ncbi:hypothetical protein B0H66DRAFT_561534 [Apodospora peruviana]|uniref:Uncharacterized protein n=1 Tax=Apodospora peruviana TaxID=516989 RepID=A0AAE0I1S7_9PEZI|nr:hypothetical protein B0H66DRAFT_561534 [Apodospora peruviana]
MHFPSLHRLGPSSPVPKRRQDGPSKIGNKMTSILKRLPYPGRHRQKINETNDPPLFSKSSHIEEWLDNQESVSNVTDTASCYPIIEPPSNELTNTSSPPAVDILPLPPPPPSDNVVASESSLNTTPIQQKIGSNNRRDVTTSVSAEKQSQLRAAVTRSRNAEALHGYDVGVVAALQSMLVHWTSHSEERHISAAEKRIFLREAQRLTELIDDAEAEMVAGNSDLLENQEAEERLWGLVGAGGQNSGGMKEKR